MDVDERLETAVRQAPPTPPGDAEAIYAVGRRRARRRKTLRGATGVVVLMGVATLGVQNVEWFLPGEVEVADQPDTPSDTGPADAPELQPQEPDELDNHPASEELVLEVLEEYGYLPVSRNDDGLISLARDGDVEQLEGGAGLPLVLNTYQYRAEGEQGADPFAPDIERHFDRIETAEDGWPEGMTVGIIQRGDSYTQYIIHAGQGVFVNLVAERAEPQALLPDIAASVASQLAELDDP